MELKKKPKKNRSEDEKYRKYRVILSDEHTHKQLWFISFTGPGFYILIASAIVAVSVVVFSLVAFTPLRTFIPGYPDPYSKRAAIQNAIKVDSLETVILRWELYSQNLKRVLSQEEPIRIDEIQSLDNDHLKAKADMSKDSVLRELVKEEEMFDLGKVKRNLPIEGLHFFTPLKGVVTQKYDNLLHPYVDIAAPLNSVVKATLDGSIIFSGWSDEAGYMIQIQHENDLVSIYRHNNKLLKKAGDKVTAGSPIALVGNTGSKSFEEHLSFELWYKGETVDPQLYIKF